MSVLKPNTIFVVDNPNLCMKSDTKIDFSIASPKCSAMLIIGKMSML